MTRNKMLVVLGLLGAGTAWAAKAPEQETTAQKLAALLVSGRAVMAEHQKLLNDPEKGDKGFSPQVFSDKVVADYLAKTGNDLKALKGAKPADEASKLLLALLEAEEEAVSEAQPVLNLKGMAFKGFTPAVFGLRTGEKFLQKTGMRLKQTSLLYRNAVNKPDTFEEATLRRFAETGWEKGKGVGALSEEGGKRVYRYMMPVYIAKPCLSCHGEPKGELDIAGRKKEGYREGELRGAISVMLKAP
ncbi:MAG: DUF3365 domain-containing protein [Deltaproteobacteria bacterium]|nr:DUF3365 domain-containing protein [Deltaproteobacteria bacterium]